MTTPTSLADLLKGGRYIKWDDLGEGAIVAGTVADVTIRQAKKYQSDELDTWDDGSPKMQAVIVLATDMSDGPDDDGMRTVVVNLWSQQKRALADACRRADVGEPRPGDRFSAVWTSGAGGARDPRQFAYQIQPKPEASPLAAELAQPAAQPTADPFAPAPGSPPASQAPAWVAGTPAAGAAPTPAAGPGTAAEQVKALTSAGLPAAQIADLLGIPITAVAALANL